jgi:hypothetical protein
MKYDIKPDNISEQQSKILEYMLTHKKGITSLECADILRITKLTTRLSELRSLGWDFTVIKECHSYITDIDTSNPKFKTIRWNRYSNPINTRSI